MVKIICVFGVRYSPLHNVSRPWGKVKQYPATMLLTADHDDRVVPLHSLKFLAVSATFFIKSIFINFYTFNLKEWFLWVQTMQHVLCDSVDKTSPQTNPIVGRIERKAGHGAGKPTKKLVRIICLHNVVFIHHVWFLMTKDTYICCFRSMKPRTSIASWQRWWVHHGWTKSTNHSLQ